MISVTSAEFQQGFGRYREMARREPVAISDDGRDSLVVLSAEEYERLRRQDRRAFYVWELPEEDIQALAEARAPEETAQYDHELNS